MSNLGKIFGDWETMPETGSRDVLAKLWHELATQKDRKNNGMTQRRHEIVMLWELYRRTQPKVVLEIGSAQGGTLAGWCYLGMPDATIISIDRDCNDCLPRRSEQVSRQIVPHDVHGLTSEGGGMMALARYQQQVIPIAGWSYDPAVLQRLLSVLAGRKIDFLSHDASHQPETFARDWKIYWPLVAEGGIFASHDIMPCADANSNKSLEWERIKREENYSALYEFRGSRNDDSMGWGVIIR